MVYSSVVKVEHYANYNVLLLEVLLSQAVIVGWLKVFDL